MVETDSSFRSPTLYQNAWSISDDNHAGDNRADLQRRENLRSVESRAALLAE